MSVKYIGIFDKNITLILTGGRELYTFSYGFYAVIKQQLHRILIKHYNIINLNIMRKITILRPKIQFRSQVPAILDISSCS